MFTSTATAGTPVLSVKWPKGAVINTLILKTGDGRFICKVKVNDGEYFALPGSYPTEGDASLTLQAYITENSTS